MHTYKYERACMRCVCVCVSIYMYTCALAYFLGIKQSIAYSVIRDGFDRVSHAENY